MKIMQHRIFKWKDGFFFIFLIFFTVNAFLLITIFFTKNEYKENMRKLPSIEFKFTPSKQEEILDTKWLNPGARISVRIFSKNYREILSLSKDLNNKKTTYELWKENGKHTSDVDKYFNLSVVAGDIFSSYLIINDAIKEDNTYADLWLHNLTNTYWQLTNEYLHELDFGRAYHFNQLYLSLSSKMLSSQNLSAPKESERNRTLAYILQREFKTHRIYSLCSKPGISNSFGSLLGGEWGDKIELNDSRYLTLRREKNKKIYCNNKNTRYINYEIEIKSLNNKKDMKSCNLFGLECTYNYLLDKIIKGNNFQSNEIITFINKCSYLSDDIVYMYIKKSLADMDFNFDIKVIKSFFSCRIKKEDFDYFIYIKNIVNDICNKNKFQKKIPYKTKGICDII